MPSESNLSAKCKLHIKQLQSQGVPIWGVKIHGGPHQQAGLPDWHITYFGKSYWVELKAKGKKPSPLQEATMKRIREAGGIATWLDSIDKFKEMFRA